MEDPPQADHLRFHFDPRTTLDSFAGQRRRFAAAVERLSLEELASPSRCAEWSVADVLRHLVWVDLVLRGIWSGDRSIADGFDPRTTPNDAVRLDRVVPDDAVRDRYLVSTEAMVGELESSGPERFGLPSLSPAGPVPWWMSAVHAGWDSSIHERDVLAPLGRPVEAGKRETVPALAYSLVLASFFAGRDLLWVRLGGVEVRRDGGPVVARAAADQPGHGDPPVGSPTAVGAVDPVRAVDAIAGRVPVAEALEGDAVVVHRLGGLARYFTSVPA